MKKILMGLAVSLIASPLYAGGHAASGDAAEGEKAFKKCVACHVVQDDSGKVLAGRNAKTGPNLYNIAGRAPGSADFKYGKSIVEYGQKDGVVWTEENFVAYVQDPTGFLKEVLDDKRARGKMSYKVKKEEDAVNLYAYLAQFSK